MRYIRKFLNQQINILNQKEDWIWNIKKVLCEKIKSIKLFVKELKKNRYESVKLTQT